MRRRRGLVSSRRGLRGAVALPIALAVLRGPLPARAELDASALVVSPQRRSVTVRVGEGRVFSALVAGERVDYAWSIDGRSVATGRRFELRPRTGDVGTHELSVTAVAGSTAARHTWEVEVAAAAPPRIVRARPGAAALEVPPSSPLEFSVVVEPGSPSDEVRLEWTVNGVPAGSGDRLQLEAPARGSQRVRVVAMSGRGAAAMREWLVASAAAVAAAPAPDAMPVDPELAELVRTAKVQPHRSSEPPPPPALPEPPALVPAPEPEPRANRTVTVHLPEPAAEKPAPAVEPVETEKRAPSPEPRAKPEPPAPKKIAKAEPRPEPKRRPEPEPEPRRPPPPPPPRRVPPPEPEPQRLAALPRQPIAPPPPPAPRGVSEDDVRAMLFRYEQAWRTRDVGELRRMGQIETGAQADALARYFSDIEQLEVIVHVLDLRIDGDRGVVRFTRRDRFRDPAGREVTKESPPIEKTIVRTPDGLKFAPRS